MTKNEGDDENSKEVPGGDDSTSESLNETEAELLKEQYVSLREEAHLRIELQNKRLTRGLTVIGAIMGYGLLSGNHAVIAVTPFILGVLYIESARMYRQTGALARHMYDIETQLQDVATLFCWEHKYGPFFGPDPEDKLRFNLPTYGLIAAAVVAYFALAWVSYRFWPPRFGTWYLNSNQLIVLMVVYAVLVGAVWCAAHLYIHDMSETE